MGDDFSADTVRALIKKCDEERRIAKREAVRKERESSTINGANFARSRIPDLPKLIIDAAKAGYPKAYVGRVGDWAEAEAAKLIFDEWARGRSFYFNTEQTVSCGSDESPGQLIISFYVDW